MNTIDYFEIAQDLNLSPALLQFNHPLTNEEIEVCGIKPRFSLTVTNDHLLKNGNIVGRPVEIFDHLQKPQDFVNKTFSTADFFPCFIGYFSYEFLKFLPDFDGRAWHMAS